jgi:hypothetical protein
LNNPENKFSDDVAVELVATRTLLSVTRDRLNSAMQTIAELETLLILERTKSSNQPPSTVVDSQSKSDI